MPVPIRPIPDSQRDDSSKIDFSFLTNLAPGDSLPKKKTVQASNNDASLLFKIWASSEKDPSNHTVKISKDMEITSRELMRLKTMGFLTGGAEEVTFTRKGKIIITTMALGETNKFEKSRQEKSYTEILASMSKRGKTGYRSAQRNPHSYYSACTANCLNLKKLK